MSTAPYKSKVSHDSAMFTAPNVVITMTKKKQATGSRSGESGLRRRPFTAHQEASIKQTRNWVDSDFGTL